MWGASEPLQVLEFWGRLAQRYYRPSALSGRSDHSRSGLPPLESQPCRDPEGLMTAYRLQPAGAGSGEKVKSRHCSSQPPLRCMILALPDQLQRLAELVMRRFQDGPLPENAQHIPGNIKRGCWTWQLLSLPQTPVLLTQ